MKPNYDKFPKVRLEDGVIRSGWENCMQQILADPKVQGKTKRVIVIDCYSGCLADDILRGVSILNPTITRTEPDWLKSEEEIIKLTYPDVTDDQIFGFMTRLSIQDFISEGKVDAVCREIKAISAGTIVLFGTGASQVIPDPDLLVYVDMARWEIQQRMKKGRVHGLGVGDSNAEFSYQYKRGYFVDWRVCDNLKISLINRIDYFLDTNTENSPALLPRRELLDALDKTVSRPFRVVPYFDPGPWGGQWMKKVCNLDPDMDNFAWCFDCVPEENSLMLESGNATFETPSINLVFFESVRLLGQDILNRFGAEFPIRFDFLDTMGGGNLSFQVHPTKDYIRKNFGMHYTQDESYYLLDTGKDACVYLGLKDNIDRGQMVQDLELANLNGNTFNVEKYVNRWPAKKHDHFLIPAGTVHCSGSNSMVLEISATPFIFTFKMWDWGRMGLDGKPRPINIHHAANVINWEGNTDFVQQELIDQVEIISRGEDWIEEKTGLHREEFIETRRHWFTSPVLHHTGDTVNVLNLVEGHEAVITSPDGAFEPFVVHYAETFIIPAAIGDYLIGPTEKSYGSAMATIKAFVKPQAGQ